MKWSEKYYVLNKQSEETAESFQTVSLFVKLLSSLNIARR